MKKIFFLTSLFFYSLSFSQEETQLNKYVTGIQVGFLGAEIYNEARISKNISLRSQISLYPYLRAEYGNNKTEFALASSISIAPKFYYNLDKRANKGYNTKNNSANYFSATLEYIPNLFVISNTKNLHVNETICLIPHWGFRRNFASHFNYEFRVGLGISKTLEKGSDLEAVPDISFKVGYDF